MATSATTVTTLVMIATVVAVPSCSRSGSATNAMVESSGSTNHPVRRSSAVAAKASAKSPESWPWRTTRTTSPPKEVGRALETNSPASRCENMRRNRRWMPSVDDTVAQRTVCST